MKVNYWLFQNEKEKKGQNLNGYKNFIESLWKKISGKEF